MTTPAEPWSEARAPGGRPVVGPDGAWQEEAAVRALARALSAVEAALRRLSPAEDVDWVGGPAARYRCRLEDVTDRLRAARAQAESAVDASAEHAAAVRQAAAALAASTPPGSPWGSAPWAPAGRSAPSGSDGGPG